MKEKFLFLLFFYFNTAGILFDLYDFFNYINFFFNIMTTKRNNKSNSKNDVRSSSLPPPSLYNIQYENSRTGMFSLREPYKNLYIYQSPQQQQQQEEEPPIYTRNLTPNVVHPKYLHVDQSIFFIFIYLNFSLKSFISPTRRTLYYTIIKTRC